MGDDHPLDLGLLSFDGSRGGLLDEVGRARGRAFLQRRRRCNLRAQGDVAAWAAGPARHGLSSPGGHLGGGSPFYRTYPTSDGHIAVACIEPHFAKALAMHIGTEEAVLERTFAAEPTAHWVEFAAEHDLPIEAIAEQ